MNESPSSPYLNPICLTNSVIAFLLMIEPPRRAYLVGILFIVGGRFGDVDQDREIVVQPIQTAQRRIF